MATTRNQSKSSILTGSPLQSLAAAAPPHDLQRVPNVSKPDATNEEWRAQIHKLQYEVDSLKQEQDAILLRHQEELRRFQNQAESDYKRAQASESSSHAASVRFETVTQDLHNQQEQLIGEKRELEKSLRLEKEQNDKLKEEVEDYQTRYSAQGRQFQYETQELKAKLEASELRAESLRTDCDGKTASLKSAQSQLSQRQIEIGDFENEIMRLKTLTDEAGGFAVIKRELADQVAHIKELESINLDNSIQIKQFHKQQKAIDVVEEEKRALESKLRIMADLRKELREAQLQKDILQEERRSWSAYLEKFASDDEDLRFDSPEDLARAFVKERFEKAGLIDQLGKINPELNAKDETIGSLEEQISSLKDEVAKLGSTSPGGDLKTRTRLERQRNLALKEIEYLRGQLKTFEAEENEFHAENFDEQKTKRISELENLVERYRADALTLQDDTRKSSDTVLAPEAMPRSSKHPHSRDDDASDIRIGELSRKNRALQEDLASAETTITIVKNELEACKSQLMSLKTSTMTRILELRDNPTSKAESIKQSSLNELRSENAALLSQIETMSTQNSSKGSETETVPSASLNRLRGEMGIKEEELANKDKQILRLKQIFSSKSREFREAVASILGWKFDFMPNGRVRVTSLFNPGISEDEGGEGSNSIVFDGDNETMKVSGGPQSAFAGEIRPLVEFWVDGKNEIPCFLAACTLEFWEKSTRAQKT